MLKTSGLMNGTARQLKITSKGFQFLLEDVNSQLWGILLRYLDGAEDRSMDTVEVLAFLFMLGSLELGRVSLSPIAGQRPQLSRLVPGIFDKQPDLDPDHDVEGYARLRPDLLGQSTLAERTLVYSKLT